MKHTAMNKRAMPPLKNIIEHFEKFYRMTLEFLLQINKAFIYKIYFKIYAT